MKKLILSFLVLFSTSSAFAVDMQTCSFKENPEATAQLQVIVNASLTGKFDRKFLKVCLETAATCEEAFDIIVVLGRGISANASN